MGIGRVDTFQASCEGAGCGRTQTFTVVNDPKLTAALYGSKLPEGWAYVSKTIPGVPEYGVESYFVTTLLCPACVAKR